MNIVFTAFLAGGLVWLTNLPHRRGGSSSIGLPQIVMSLTVAYWLVNRFAVADYLTAIVILAGFIGLVVAESRLRSR